MKNRFTGIDFGTTNSALAVSAGGAVELARFPFRGGSTSTFRSILHFDPEARDPRGGAAAAAGPRAIEQYLDSGGGGRLIQSIKSHLAGDLQSTDIFGRSVSLEELAALIVRDLRAAGEAQFGPLGNRVVVGRPVRFAGAAAPEDEQRALKRLRSVFERCGFDDVVFEYEPVAAAYFYESELDHDEVVLIADFGGGTSDFCLVEVGPQARRRRPEKSGILGTEGIGLAGDAFDSEIVGHVVSPRLGLGSHYRSYLDQKLIPVPAWIYSKLKRWHHLSLLKSRDTMRFLREVRAQAVERDQIDSLIHLIDYDLGYYLYQAVEHTKVSLSSTTSVGFSFVDAPIQIETGVLRTDFEHWCRRLLNEIDDCVVRLLDQTALRATDVDRVFLTGGSSLVPAVRALFEARFGSERIRSGGELTSVALGLAHRAREVFG